MPGLDGYEVCRRIRQAPVASDVPVIMVTSMTAKEDRLRAVEAGANDFIAKPVDKTELRVRTASLLLMKEAQDDVKRYRVHLESLVEERTTSLQEALHAMAAAQRLAYLAQLDTVERLAILAEYKDRYRQAHQADERILRDHRARPEAAPGRGRVDSPRQPDARRRQDRRPGFDPAEAVEPGRRGVGHHAPPSRDGSRILDHSSSELLQAGTDHRALPPRAMGRHGLSEWAERREHPALGPHLRGR